MATTLRTTEATHRNLKELSHATGLPLQTVLERAVAAYKKTVFLESLNEDFATLRARPEDWEEEMAERRLWEQTLSDGLIADGNKQD